MRQASHNVLITGGAKGIGFALATRFHAAGNHVTLAGRDRAALDTAAAKLSGAKTIAADISTSEGRDAIVSGAPDTTVLVNNAGVQFNGGFADSDDARIDAEVEVNLLAPLHLTRRFLPLLSGRGEAAIVNVTSILAIVPKESAAVYCATKAALRSFTRTLRWQLEGTPVRVFEVVPPVVDTAMTAGRGGDKLSPEALADQVWDAWVADKYEILVGKASVASKLARFLPSVAEKIIRKK